MSKKVDKGFQLIYWKLSYRRKFIRTLWTIPIFVISIGIIIFLGNGIFMSRVMPLILIILFIIQLIYNYIKWKKDEQ
jgi:hypothetical protein